MATGLAAECADAVHARVLLHVKLSLHHGGDHTSLPARVQANTRTTHRLLSCSRSLRIAEDVSENHVDDCNSTCNLASTVRVRGLQHAASGEVVKATGNFTNGEARAEAREAEE